MKSFRSFSAADLAQGLGALGIGAGDTVLIHSAYDAFTGFTGKPTDVIAVLQDVVGSSGVLMMPTLPFTGTAVEYVSTNPVFDVRRTPSRMGLLSELFRRSPDVLRSVHPTHPVAAWGQKAASLVEGHHLAGTPCGSGSPFARLLERRGKILLIGTNIDVLTFYHTLEELLEENFPASPFTRELYVLESRDYFSNIVVTRTRLFEPAISRRRNLHKLVPDLRQHGAWREKRVGHLNIIALNAEDVLLTARSMADRGTYCYD